MKTSVCIAVLALAVNVFAQEDFPLIANPEVLSQANSPTTKARQLLDKGLDYLKSQQKPDGGWQSEKDPPAITALVLRAFVQDPRYDANTDFVRKGYDKLLTYQVDSGGIYQDILANYNTAIAVSSLAAADEPSFQPSLDKALAFLRRLQWHEKGAVGPKGETVTDASNPWYGGWGYGNHGRPDLSNVQMTLDALHDAGVKPDDPAFQAAVTFVTRLQNNSETNSRPWAGDDGGFVYAPGNESTDAQGDSEAGSYVGPDGRKMWRSYGSMTYAGLKSMIYAGVSKDDPRVKAAIEWIRNNWALDENPGMGAGNPDQAKHGLYYYYRVMAQALNAYDEPIITDSKGVNHDWRVELTGKLGSLQRPDGSWAGETRWMESNPVLVTAYVADALHEILDDLRQHPGK